MTRLRVWDASTGAELKVLKGHSGVVESVAFSMDNMRVVSGFYDWSVHNEIRGKGERWTR